MKFLKTAYLPQNAVELCIAGNGVKDFKDELFKLGVNILETEENTLISGKISNHADLNFNYCGNGVVFADSSQLELAKTLKNKGFKCNIIKETVSGAYPTDCLLNCIITEKMLICNLKCISENILQYAQKTERKIVNVKQGYVKCSVCPVYENAYITDDESIYKALSAEKFDVLLIKKGSIRLEGYGYGFFGGCCGKISEKNIAFFGDIKKHSCYDNIKAFTANYGIQLISLGSGRLTDIGSLIPICEKEF